MTSRAKDPTAEIIQRIAERIAELLNAFVALQEKHSENWGIPPHGFQSEYWTYKGPGREGDLIVQCSACDYRMKIDPETGDLAHLLGDPVEAMREIFCWKDVVAEITEYQKARQEEQK